MKRSLTALAIMLAFSTAFLAAAAASFQVTAPNGWKKKEGSAAPAQYMKGTSSFLVTIDTMPKEANTPDAYVDFVKKQLTKVFGKVDFISVTKVTIGGIEGRELVYASSAYGLNMKYNVVYLFKNGKAYTLTGGSTKADFDGVQADFKAFSKSFVLK